MTFPTAFSVKVERFYETKDYLSHCKDDGLTPTKEGFLQHIEEDLWNNFHQVFCDGDLKPVD